MADEARILVVCTGNICRSPFIERLLQLRLDEHSPKSDHGDPPSPGSSILVRSAGTGALTGSAMDERAAAQLVAQGGDPTGFSARDLTADLIAEADLVLTATQDHRGQVALMYPKALRRGVHVLRLRRPGHCGPRGRRAGRPGRRELPGPDLIIAAAAAAHDATVLHHDQDFDLIAAVTGQVTRWIVTPGTGHGHIGD